MAAIVLATAIFILGVLVLFTLWMYRDLMVKAQEHERRMDREERDYDVLMKSIDEEKETER